MYNFILENKELIKVFYALVIGIICLIIVLRTNRLFQLSFHQGIRYFRNAFFFYGIAFILRYFLGAPLIDSIASNTYVLFIDFIFEFFLIMGGFFLLYSLLWKKIEGENETYYTSLFHPKISVFYLMTLIIASLDLLWHTYATMFVSQIIIFFIALIVSFNNYRKNSGKGKFLKFYFVAMFLSFVAWIANTIAALYLHWNQIILFGVYGLNIIIFLLFLYGVVRVTKKW